MEVNEFKGKNIVVTGASSGIGLRVATYFLNSEANVVLAGQDIWTMKEFCESNNFKNATITSFNLTTDMSVYDFRSTIIEAFDKKVHIVVNCAGCLLDGDIEKTFPQDFDYCITVNLRSVFLIMKLLKQYMQPDSCFINVSCLYGTRPCCGAISSAMSKAGLETLTKYAAAEFGKSNGIRVNAVTACPVDTNILRVIRVSEQERDLLKKKMEKNIPLGRMAYPEEVAKAIIFLASVRSKQITGEIIKVDGGRSLTSSGYVHYKGLKNMNSRFEPDGVKMGEWFSEMKKSVMGPEKVLLPILNQDELSAFVENTMKESNFTTNKTDAHLHLNSTYKSLKSD